MKNKDIEFTCVKGDGSRLHMLLHLSKDSISVDYNGQSYSPTMPGEVLEDEIISNPKPLPKGTYAFKIDGVLFLVVKTNIHGIMIQSVDPRVAISYKGKNTFDTVMKYLIPGIALAAIILTIILMI